MEKRKIIRDSLSKLSSARGGSDGRGTLLFTWGAGYNGQLGQNFERGQPKYSAVPLIVIFKQQVAIRQIACGGFHTAALTDTGSVWTWGDGRLGQLGHGSVNGFQSQFTPSCIESLEGSVSIKEIACGLHHTVALAVDGKLFSWGWGKHGQLGHGGRTNSNSPREVGEDLDFAKVSCGDRHTAAITNRGRVYTWGFGDQGQLGHSEHNGDVLKPKLVDSISDLRMVSIACGSINSAAQTEAGDLYIWGFGEHLFPNKGANFAFVPRLLEFNEKIDSIACGQSHLALLTTDGNVYCWGSGTFGQLGHGTNSNLAVPRLVLEGKQIVQVSCGRYHTTALNANGVLYTWGCGENGQLGHGSDSNESIPRVIEELLPNVVGQVACGEHHSAALTSFALNSIPTDLKFWFKMESHEYQLKRNILGKNPQKPLGRKELAMVREKTEDMCKEWMHEEKTMKQEQQARIQNELDQMKKHRSIVEQMQKTHAQLSGNDLAALDEFENESPRPGSMSPRSRGHSPFSRGPSRLSQDGKISPDILPNVNHNNHTNANNSNNHITGLSTAMALGVTNVAEIQKRLGLNLPKLVGAHSGHSGAKTARRPKSRKAGHNSSQLKAMLSPRILDNLRSAAEDGTKFDEFAKHISHSSGTAIIGGINSRKTPELVLSPLPPSGSMLQPWIALAPKSPEPHQTSQMMTKSQWLIQNQQEVASSPRVVFHRTAFDLLDRLKREVDQTGKVQTREMDKAFDLVQKFRVKYDLLKGDRRKKEALLEVMRNDCAHLEEAVTAVQSNATPFAERRKQLMNQFATVALRNAEADENLKNYRIIVAHLKDEQSENTLELTQLKKLVQENESLYSVVQRQKDKAMLEKRLAKSEINDMDTDIGEFGDFLHSQISRFRDSIVSIKRAKHELETMKQKKKVDLARRQTENIARMKQVVHAREKLKGELLKELESYNEKLQFFEERFDQITAVTGMTDHEQIIDKFFNKEKVREDLDRNINDAKKRLNALENEKKGLESRLRSMNGVPVESRWKEMDAVQQRIDQAKSRVARIKQNYLKAYNTQVAAEGGLVNLMNKLNFTQIEYPGSSTSDLALPIQPTVTMDNLKLLGEKLAFLYAVVTNSTYEPRPRSAHSVSNSSASRTPKSLSRRNSGKQGRSLRQLGIGDSTPSSTMIPQPPGSSSTPVSGTTTPVGFKSMSASNSRRNSDNDLSITDF
eukprot:GILK01004885.1.p1 GENE.GILK01004885.1~~GILK01004885.1.p1  ORF type:complete len:1295 (-),score=295.34 GILK01004885.1:364-3981(-)